ncbi:hypothetical protein [Pseudodesulfovibrio sediminis]|uniref:DNA mismatch endonuclease Vsr n=1 Tax=Pseudodesulfovibrio sediminis TaxID=2810563 RepID=A0ABN6ESH6_9BACT|nr:hypothetical protein [Pseudodesulfovibrio sediminis]BCS88432.1 hypothetical protein PSDVSF_16740 [Pseudodesulfovibrio sediminis]
MHQNKLFWLAKFDANVKRDKNAEKALIETGWKVIVEWGCETQKRY